MMKLENKKYCTIPVGCTNYYEFIWLNLVPVGQLQLGVEQLSSGEMGSDGQHVCLHCCCVCVAILREFHDEVPGLAAHT